MKHFLILFLISVSVIAQPYKNGQKTRHRFAQSSIGLDLYHAWGGSTILLTSDSGKVSSGLNNSINPRIHIAGLHFWGHAELYFNINLATIHTQSSSLKVKQSQNDIFGVKIFPKAVEFGKLNFYIGTSLAGSNFKAGNSAMYSKMNVPVTAGLFYFKHKFGFDLSFTYLFNNSYDYYYSKTTNFNVQQPPLLINFGIRKLFETTVSAEKDYLSGRTDSVYQALKKEKKLSSIYFGGGPSSSFYLKEDENNSNTFDFMGNKMASVFPEFNLGYFYHPWRMHTALVLRYAELNKSAFDVKQKFTRLATGIESHFLLFDYNGFVPFLGPHLSYETLSYSENNGGIKKSSSFSGFKPGIVFGWDIMPDKLQYFTLRTNLRYFPDLNIDLKNGKRVSLDQIEFNFIEFIYYPARKKNITRAL